ncbi:MAG: hypothetical protein ACK4YP_26420, partial [Myxococcota bacterium]
LPVGFGAIFAGTALRGPGLLAELVHQLVDPKKLAEALTARGTAAMVRGRLRRGTLGFGLVTAASGLLGGLLAAFVVTAPTGTEAFAEQLGSYTLWSWPVVNVPVLLASTWVLRDVLIALEDGAGRKIEELAPD